MLSQIIEFTENNVDEQTNGVLSKTASLFEELADFLNVFDVMINKTVSTNDQYTPPNRMAFYNIIIQVIEDAVDVIDSFLQWESENVTVASSSRSVQLITDNN